jgi:hypothetical protein
MQQFWKRGLMTDVLLVFTATTRHDEVICQWWKEKAVEYRLMGDP